MSKWFYFNLVLLVFAIWKIADHTPIPLHILFGALGLFLVLFNWTRHAVFSTIRNTSDRKKKIKLANISKKIVPFHRYIGTTALILIIIHAMLVIDRFGGFYWQNIKMISGLLTGLVLIGMVTSGWLRLIWPTVRKRMIHIWLGITLFFLIAIHLIL
ncbi:hypothetical protein [Virgibacillus doumboii]|uniref:hypothetical protein n=1 Tax=Virgibacillus doumboii TaxID=2697503 RepID=UPI0013DFBD63|nr:hypothetical protein [Virgibacillus doumboii]